MQSQWARITPRGPWRLAFLIVASLALLSLVAPSLASVIAQPSVYLLAALVVVGVPLIALMSRAWVAGTFVSDTGVKVSAIVSTQYARWDEIDAVRVEVGRTRWLGTPLRIPGSEIVIDLQGERLRTHVGTASPDLWLRPQAWDSARDRLRQWWRETRDPQDPSKS